MIINKAKKAMTFRGLLIVLICIALSLTMIGCSDGQKTKQWDDFTESLATDLVEEGVFDDELAEIDDNLFYSMYGIDSAHLKEYKVFMSSGGTADEIGIFYCQNEKDAKAVEDMVKVRIEDQISIMENYIPDEVTKLEESVLVRSGPYVILCISGDSDKAKEIIEEYL